MLLLVKRQLEINSDLWKLIKSFAALKDIKINEAIEHLLDEALKEFKEATKNV